MSPSFSKNEAGTPRAEFVSKSRFKPLWRKLRIAIWDW